MNELITTMLPGIFALLGVLIGGFVTYKTQLNIKDKEIEHELSQEKKKVYVEFLSQVNVAALSAIENKSNPFEKMNEMTSLVAQIELIGDKTTVTKARQLCNVIMHMYSNEITTTVKELPESKQEFISSVKAELGDNT